MAADLDFAAEFSEPMVLHQSSRRFVPLFVWVTLAGITLAIVASLMFLSPRRTITDAELAEAEYDNGSASLKASDLQGSVEHFSEAIRLSPSGRYYRARADAWIAIGNGRSALDDLREAKALEGETTEWHLRMGRAYLLLALDAENKSDVLRTKDEALKCSEFPRESDYWTKAREHCEQASDASGYDQARRGIEKVQLARERFSTWGQHAHQRKCPRCKMPYWNDRPARGQDCGTKK